MNYLRLSMQRKNALDLLKAIKKDFSFPEPAHYLEGGSHYEHEPKAVVAEEPQPEHEPDSQHSAEELKKLTVVKLRALACEYGVSEEDIDEAEDSDSPKTAVIKLILPLVGRRATGELAAAAGEMENAPPLNDAELIFWLRRHGLGMSLADKLHSWARGDDSSCAGCSVEKLEAGFAKLQGPGQLLISTGEISPADQRRLREALAADAADAEESAGLASNDDTGATDEGPTPETAVPPTRRPLILGSAPVDCLHEAVKRTVLYGGEFSAGEAGDTLNKEVLDCDKEAWKTAWKGKTHQAVSTHSCIRF